MAERGETVEEQAVRDGSAVYVVEPDIATAEDVPPGYKRTDVGVIPDDWEEVLLGDIAHIRSGGTPSTASREFWSGGIPWCTPTDITALSGRKYLLETERTISRKGLQASSAEVIPRKSIVMTTRATIGECAINMVAMTTNQGFKNLVPTEVEPEFLYYLMSTQKDRLIQLCGGSTFLEIGKKALKQFIVALPVGAEEQRAIATALSDADALIESLDRLIAKKRAIKQAAMQQLLTGQTRLPGFTGEWETKRLGEIADIRSGGTPSTAMAAFWNGGVPWCTPTDITALRGRKYLSETERTISHAGLHASSAESIPPQSIIMTTRATIGECAINTVPMTTNQGFKNLVPFNADTEFLYYLMTTKKSQLVQLCGGSTFLEIGKKQLHGFELMLPPSHEEQQAIVTVLSDMDTEIEGLERRRDKARQIKQGMMQQLLTGRVRLVAPQTTEPAA